MKKLIIMTVFLFSVISCFDDSKIWESINDHESRIKELELMCYEMNVNISSLAQIVDALQENDYVTSINDILEDGIVVGYEIYFLNRPPVTIYHGKDGSDGKNGYTPIIGVAKGSDGEYYWTLDGSWLLDTNGNKIPTTGKDGADGKDGIDGEDGKDGITPKLKIEKAYWYISFDNGVSWHKLDKAVGEDGKDGQDGDSFFKSVEQDDNYVYLTLADGSVFTIPLANQFNRIQSVTYVPGFAGGKAAFVKTYDENKGYAQLDFLVNPAKAVVDLDSCWSDLLRLRSVETTTKSVNFIDLKIESFESDIDEGIITLEVSGKSLPDEFFNGKRSYSAALFISDGDNDVSSSFFDIIAIEADDRPDMGLSVPLLSWGEDVEKVKEFMSDFELTYSDKMTLIYNGMKSEHLISYEFENDELVAAAMFIKEDVCDLYKVLTLLEGYDVLHEYDGEYGEYASSVANTYAEICKSEVSGEIYWFIGWSEYAVDMGNNTITYLSSDNKAISVGTLYGFGADLVANTYDKTTNIGTMVFSAPVTSIPDMAFSGAAKLSSMNLPESVKHIGKEAFANTGLTSIKIPKNLKSIDSDAFLGCNSLTKVFIEDLHVWCKVILGNINSNPLNYAHNLYLDGILAEDLVIPDDVSNIEDFTFYGASCIKSVTIPESITSVGEAAFGLCSNLIRVDISDMFSWFGISFESATSNPLYNAKNLYLNGVLVSELTIPDGVSGISQYSFCNCSSLSSITIDNSIESIGKSAFAGCDNLAEIFIWKTTPPSIGTDTFLNIPSTAVIYVPHISIADYKTKWSKYSSKLFTLPFRPIECTDLSITADDVIGNYTSTTIYYEAVVNGYVNDTYMTDYVITGISVSDEFPQNTSIDEDIQVELFFTFMGQTASTTITHTKWTQYVVPSPGVWNVNNSSPFGSDNYYHYYKGTSSGKMTVEIFGYYEITLYVRSFSNTVGGDDCIMISHLDMDINTYTYPNDSKVKAHTKGMDTEGSSTSAYREVTFTNIDGGRHVITIVYRGGTSALFSGAGHVVIPK